MQEGKQLVSCAAGGGGGDVKRTIELYMLERCDTRSGANWGQFQRSSLSLWSPGRAGWKTSCFPRQERRKGRRCGWEAALRSLPDNSNLIRHKRFPSLPTEYLISICSTSPLLQRDRVHSFLSIVLHALSISCKSWWFKSKLCLTIFPSWTICFVLHSKCELWSSHNLSDGGRVCGLVHKRPSSHQTLRVWSQTSHLMRLTCLDLSYCASKQAQWCCFLSNYIYDKLVQGADNFTLEIILSWIEHFGI